jgi:hypothetical protein
MRVCELENKKSANIYLIVNMSLNTFFNILYILGDLPMKNNIQ